MDRRLAIIMAREAQKQARYAFLSVLNMDENIKNMGNQSNGYKHQSDLFWMNMQSFLICTANISKLLFGDYGKESERELVREILQTPSNSKLRSRRLRNHLEHFDQRLLDWDKNSTRKNYIQDTISNDGSFLDMDKKDIMRYYNPETYTVIFRGEKFELKTVVREVKRILEVKIPLW